MSVLRLVKERNQNVEVENDLRGLGGTTLFEDLSPEPILSLPKFLSCKLSDQLNIVETDLSQSDLASLVHLKVQSQSCYKTKALSLFAYGLFWQKNNKGFGALWFEEPFTKELGVALNANLSNIKRNFSSLDKKQSGLQLDSRSQFVLSQSGFEFNSQNEWHLLSSNDVDELIKNFRPEAKSTYQSMAKGA